MPCKTYKKLERERRLNTLGLVLKSKFESNSSYPTITQLARANRVSTSTIYRDLDILRLRLGDIYIPNLQLGGKNDKEKC